MRFELPEAKKLTLEMVIPTRWGDMDAMGHDLLPLPRDRSYEWLHRVAGTPDPAGEGPVIVNTFCNFLRQLKYPGNVLAKHYGVCHAGAHRRTGRALRERRRRRYR